MKLGKILTGLVLVLIGTLLLLINMGLLAGMHLWEQWPLILVFIGLCLQFEVIDNRRAWGALIPGGILFTYGMLFFLCSNYGWHIIAFWWPVFLLGPALGLLEAYLFGDRAIGLLIAGGILGLIGSIFLLQNLFGFYQLVLPLALILCGLLILIIGFRKPRNMQ